MQGHFKLRRQSLKMDLKVLKTGVEITGKNVITALFKLFKTNWGFVNLEMDNLHVNNPFQGFYIKNIFKANFLQLFSIFLWLKKGYFSKNITFLQY